MKSKKLNKEFSQNKSPQASSLKLVSNYSGKKPVPGHRNLTATSNTVLYTSSAVRLT